MKATLHPASTPAEARRAAALSVRSVKAHTGAAPGPGQSGAALLPAGGRAPRSCAQAACPAEPDPSCRPSLRGGAFNRGRHLWSAWCSQDAGTPGPWTETASPPARKGAEAASGVKVWEISGGLAGWSEASAVSLEARLPGVLRWLLTGRGAPG